MDLIYSITIVFVAATSTIVGYLSLRKEPSAKVNQTFFAVTLLVALATLSYPLVNTYFEYDWINLLNNRGQFVVFFTFAPVLYLFVHFFPYETKKLNLPFFSLIATISAAISTLFLISDLGIEQVIDLGDRTDIVRGPLYYLGIGYTTLLVLFTLISLSIKYRKLGPADKEKVRYVAAGFATLFILIILLAVVAPLTTGTTEISNFGFIAFLPWIGAVYYAILRHRLFDIRFLFGTTLYYLILAAYVYVVFYITIIFYEEAFDSVFNPYAYFVGAFVSIIFVVSFIRLNKHIQRTVTTKLINPGYDPFEIVDSLGKKLGLTVEIEQVIPEGLDIVRRTVRASFEAIVVFEKKQNYKRWGQLTQDNELGKEFYERIIYLWQQTTPAPLVLDELRYIQRTQYKDLESWVLPLDKEMQEKSIKVVIPITTRDNILGVILLGEKDGDTAYTKQDIDLLSSIANSLSLAIARAQLFAEVKTFNEQLQQRIDEATASLRQQNADLENALYNLQKLRQQEQDMVDILGHELRTPITMVRNALSVLELDYKKDQHIETEKLGEYIEKALRGARREMILIETLLAATKIDANRIQLSLNKVQIKDLIVDAYEAHKDLTQERGLELLVENKEQLNENSPEVYVDRVRAQEVIDNFLSNAVKYTMQGSVTISSEEVVDQESGKQMIAIRITDTGIGIPADDIPKLGRKFFRARQYIEQAQGESESDVKVSGTGLGLYVSFQMTRLMGGKIEIKSEVGQGSTFSVLLPKYTGQEPQKVDQTFGEDQDLEERLKESIEREKKKFELQAEEDKKLGVNQELRAQLALEEAKKAEQEKLQEQQTPIEEDKGRISGRVNYSTENPTQTGKQLDVDPKYKRLISTNDLIGQISRGRQYLEGRGPKEENENEQKEKQGETTED